MDSFDILDQLVPMTELSRDTSKTLKRVTDGGKQLIIVNQSVPVAVIVPVDEWRRIKAAAEGAPTALRDARPVPVATNGAPPGYTQIGFTPDGEPVNLKLACHTLAVGSTQRVLDTLNAMLAGANFPGSTTAEVVIGTSTPTLFTPPRPPRGPVTYEVTYSACRLNDTRGGNAAAAERVADFRDEINLELDIRSQRFHEVGAKNIDDYNSVAPESPIPNLIVVFQGRSRWPYLPTGEGIDLLEERLLTSGADLGVYLWYFDETPCGIQQSPECDVDFSQAVSFTRDAVKTRLALGLDAGAETLPDVPPGGGLVRVDGSEEVVSFQAVGG